MFLALFDGPIKSFGLRIFGIKRMKFRLSWLVSIFPNNYRLQMCLLCSLNHISGNIFSKISNSFFCSYSICVLLLLCIFLKSLQLLVRTTSGRFLGLQQSTVGGQISVLWMVALPSAKCEIYIILGVANVIFFLSLLIYLPKIIKRDKQNYWGKQVFRRLEILCLQVSRGHLATRD